MDKRIIDVSLEDEVLEANKKNLVAVCKHIINHDIVDFIHLDFDPTQEMLVVQCGDCAPEMYEDCDLLLEETYVLVNAQAAEDHVNFYRALLSGIDRTLEDMVLVCNHDGNILRDSFERKLRNECH